MTQYYANLFFNNSKILLQAFRAPCDYFQFPKLYMAMKVNHFAQIEDIEHSGNTQFTVHQQLNLIYTCKN